jgi:hypothetical protein
MKIFFLSATVSLYMGGTARMNFGPSMDFPPSPALWQRLNLPPPQPIICLQPPKVWPYTGRYGYYF